MDDKPLDMSKNADSSTPETQLRSSKRLEMSAKESKQLTTSKSVEMCGNEFSKPEENREVRAEKEFIKTDLAFPSSKVKAPESRDTTPESRVSIKRNLSAGPSMNLVVKRHAVIHFGSDKKIKDKQRIFADSNVIERATVDCSSPRPLYKNTSRFYATTLPLASLTSSINMIPSEENKTLDLACDKGDSREYINASPSTSSGVSGNHDWTSYQEFSRNPNQVSPWDSITPPIGMLPSEENTTLELACDKSASREYINASPSTSSGVSGNHDWTPFQEFSRNPNQVSPLASLTPSISMSLVEQILILNLACDKSASGECINASPSRSSGISGNHDWTPFQEFSRNSNEVSPRATLTSSIDMLPCEENTTLDLACNKSASRDNMNFAPSTSSGVSGNRDCASYQEFSRNLNQVLPYVCAQCAESFSEVIRFIRHVMTHGKPFICNVCKKKFSRLGLFKNHSHSARLKRRDAFYITNTL